MKNEEPANNRKQKTPVEEKRTYSAPRLISYGDFRRLTRAKGGTRMDNQGNNMKTKSGAG